MRRSMKRGPFRPLSDERGISIVEILLAVTIMSIISVSVMGYFTAAVERSAEESRRVIAASLARMKVAELRQASLLENDMEPGRDNYDVIAGLIPGGGEAVFSANDPLPAPHEHLLDPQEINGTTYRFTAVLDRVYPDDFRIEAQYPDRVLVRLRLTVSWEDGDPPRPARSVTVDAYLAKPR